MPNSGTQSTRRDYLAVLAASTLAGAAATGSSVLQAAGPLQAADPEKPVVQHGRIRQSIVHWCYSGHFDGFEGLCTVARKLGIPSIELCPVEHWPTLKQHGLTCAISSSHGFKIGFNNRNEWEECLSVLRERIAQCAAHGVKSVITFTGMANGLSKEDGKKNCIEGLKQIVGEAEKQNVTLCLEMLNTRDDSHPMKGHPGYQGDDIDWCLEICQQVGSSHLKLLFDIYHVQIMHGDVIRRIHQCRDFLGHIHTAGNPGRGELDTKQEIYYPAVMESLLEVGYDGFVGQEFIPTRDAWEGLKQAVVLCDV